MTRANLSLLPTGCIIDGCGTDADRFNTEIIGFAIAHGFEPTHENDDDDGSPAWNEPHWRAIERILRETAAEALEWLNAQQLRPQCAFVVRDKALMYLHEWAANVGHKEAA